MRRRALGHRVGIAMCFGEGHTPSIDVYFEKCKEMELSYTGRCGHCWVQRDGIIIDV